MPLLVYESHDSLLSTPPPFPFTNTPHYDIQTPQIARVWQAKSLVGLAPASIYADVFLFATSVIYHVLKRNPIRAYGESVVVLVQTMIMVGLMWRYGTEDAALVNADVKSPSAAGIKRSAGGGLVGRSAIVLGSIAATVLCMQYLPPSMWGLLVVISTPTILVVQGPQIYKNWRQKHTGELAPLTVALAFVGSSIRIGTTIAVRLQQIRDVTLLLRYIRLTWFVPCSCFRRMKPIVASRPVPP